MDFGAILALLPQILSAVQLAQQIASNVKQDHSVTNIFTQVEQNGPQFVDLFTKVGSVLFANLPQASQVAAAAVQLNPDLVKKIQGQLNKLGATLTVDGAYGPLTKAAVTEFQKANPPLVVDGWAGPQTQAALNAKAV